MKNRHSKYSDDKLLELMKGNKEESDRAFAELYERYASRVKAYCIVSLEDDDQAMDIFQDTFIRFYNHARKKSAVKNVPGFLITIARNLTLNHKRDKKNTVPIEGLELPYDSGNQYEKNELWELINMALGLMDFKYKEAFILREMDNFTIKEIAGITGETTACIKSRVFRAHTKIMEILQPYLQDMAENK